MKRIFLTGAAGFIGHHLAAALRARGDEVLGLDNFNAYYDVALKRMRAQRSAIEIVEGDVCDTARLKALFERFQPTHCVHLAAQAGVRHSIDHPSDYVSANLEGFVSVLEACRAQRGVKLVYASSSSVYGLNTKIPFSTTDVTDRPANLYGATKKANELMAHAYHNLFGIPVTGLRYFTAYGPWGRPDMAYYRFAELILQGKPIPVFNEGRMRRDFTYIDDIVQGTVAAIDLGAECEVFNLGNNKPVELLYMIELLERTLGKQAVRHMLPMQVGEVVETFADIGRSEQLLGFRPKIPIEQGIERFVEWFLAYRGASNVTSDTIKSLTS